MKKTTLLLLLLAITYIAKSQTTIGKVNYGLSVQGTVAYSLLTVNFCTFGRIDTTVGRSKKTNYYTYGNYGISFPSNSFNLNAGAAFPSKKNPNRYMDLGIIFNSDYSFVKDKPDNKYLLAGAEIGLRWQNPQKHGFFYRLTCGVGYINQELDINKPSEKRERTGLWVFPSFTMGYNFAPKPITVKK